MPGEFHRQKSLLGYSPWGREQLDTTERLHFHTLPLICARHFPCIRSVIPCDNLGELSVLLFPCSIKLLSLPGHKIRETQVHVVPTAFGCWPWISCEIGHLVPASHPFLWRSLTWRSPLAADIQEGLELGWTPACEDRAARKSVSAPEGSALGGEKTRGC